MRDTIHVEGMSCEHCVMAIKKAAGSLPGVFDVEVDLGKKTVTVDYDPDRSSIDVIEAEIEDQGYDVVVE